MALEYRWPQADAPSVVASGRGELAERIVAVARAEGVPVRNDPNLVQVLSGIELGERIPLEAFAAVAEILAYLYRLDGTPSSATASERASGPAGSGTTVTGLNSQEHDR